MPNKITFATEEDENTFKKGNIVQVQTAGEFDNPEYLGVVAIVITECGNSLTLINLATGESFSWLKDKLKKVNHSVIIN